MPCPYCQRAIAMPPPSCAGMLFDCPHCQARFRFTGAGAMPPPPVSSLPVLAAPPVSPAVPSPPDRQQRIKKRATNFWLTAFLTAFAAFAVLIITTPHASPEQNRAVDAFWVATTFVERQLKAPRTAHFAGTALDGSWKPGCGVEDLGGGRYHSFGTVDAENSFGAEIRTGYEVWLHEVDPASHGGNDWMLDDLKIHDR